MNTSYIVIMSTGEVVIVTMAMMYNIITMVTDGVMLPWLLME